MKQKKLKKYIVNFIIKDSMIIEAENVAEAKSVFLYKKKGLAKGSLHIEYLEEFDRMEG